MLGWILGLTIVGAIVLAVAAAIMAVLCPVIAAKLIGDGMSGLG